jgi:hypothetical protein
MSEVSLSGEDHGDVMFICSLYDFVVSDGSSGLDDGFDACVCGDVNGVSEGEKCVACHG